MIESQLGYTIALASYSQYNGVLKTLQYTLSQYQKAINRNTVQVLTEAKSDIYIHSEFWYALPRWYFYNNSAKSNLLLEYSRIKSVSVTNPHVKGLVIHVESPFNKLAMKHLLDCGIDNVDWESFVKKYFISVVYLSPSELVDKLKNIADRSSCITSFLEILYRESVTELVEDCLRTVDRSIRTSGKAKIFIENTVKPCVFNNPYNNKFLLSLVANYSDQLGFAYDEEHSFALGDDSYFIAPSRQDSILDLPDFIKEVSTLIHYNVPPNNILQGSRKDVHSKTSIFDEGINTQYHVSVLKILDSLGVPFVREVYEDVLLNETNSLKKWTL